MKSILSILLLLVGVVLQGQYEYSYTDYLKGSDIALGSSMNIVLPSSTAGDISNRVWLKYDQENPFYKGVDYRYEVSFTYDIGGGDLVGSLSIDYFHSGSMSYKHIDLLEVEDGSLDISLNVTGVSVFKSDGQGGEVSTDITSDVILMLETIVIDDAVMSNDLSLSLEENIYINDENLNATGELVVSWDIIAGADEYDFEWTYVNDFKRDGSTMSQKSKSELYYDFDYNSTRVTRTESYYELPLIYETGYVLFRYRGVELDSEGYRTAEGRWNYQAVGSTVESQGLVSTYPSWSMYQVLENSVMSRDINWEYNVNFYENGRKAEILSYKDGMNSEHQSLSRNQTEDVMMAQGVVYDYAKRPTVTALPSPVSEGNWEYKEGLYRDENGGVYDAEDFDNASTEGVAPAMDEENSTGSPNYYSEHNPNKEGFNAYLPDGDGYVFSQTILDEKGRVSSQSGVGEKLSIGSGQEQKYYYVNPNQRQLCELFGTDVGLARNYRKTYVKDANGQFTVQYYNEDGEVIASGLAGSAPDNLLSLSEAGEYETTDLTKYSNVKDSDEKSYTVYEEFVVLEDMDDPDNVGEKKNSGFGFTYEVSIEDFKYACDLNLDQELCFNCFYDLEVRIWSEDGAEEYALNATIGLSEITTGTPDTYAYQMVDPATGTSSYGVYFDELDKGGRYFVKKKLTLNTARQEELIEALFTSDANCFSDYNYFEQVEVSKINVDNCIVNDCRTCEQELLKYDESLANGEANYTVEGRAELLSQCENICSLENDNTIGDLVVESSCADERFRLAQDFMPSGQYAGYEYGFNASEPVFSAEERVREDALATYRHQQMDVAADAMTVSLSEETTEVLNNLSTSALSDPSVRSRLIRMEASLSSSAQNGTASSEMTAALQTLQTELDASEGNVSLISYEERAEALDAIEDLVYAYQFTKYSNDPLSIFNLHNELPNPAGGVGVSIADVLAVFEVNDRGVLISVAKAIQQGKMHLVIEQFDINWALALVDAGFHPEGCYYAYCLESESSKVFDKAFSEVQTYSQALGEGYLNSVVGNTLAPASSNAILDPLFDDGASFANDLTSDLRLAFINELTNYYHHKESSQIISLYDYASALAHDIDLFGSTLNLSEITVFGTDECTKDLEWRIFRDKYLELKWRYYEDARTAYAIDHGCYNSCIGEPNFDGLTEEVFVSNEIPFDQEYFACYNLINKAPSCKDEAQIESDIRDILIQIKVLEKQISDKEGSLKKKYAELKDLYDRKAELEKLLLSINEKIEEQQNKVTILTEELNEKDLLIAELNARKQVLEGSLSSMMMDCNRDSIIIVQDSIQHLKQALMDLKFSKASNSGDISSIQTDKSTLIAQLDVAKNNLAAYSENFSELQTAESYLQKIETEINGSVFNFNFAIDSLGDLEDSLSLEYTKIESELALLLEDKASVFALRSTKQSEYDILLEAYLILVDDSTGLDTIAHAEELAEYQAILAEVQDQIDQLTEDYTQLCNEEQALRDLLAELLVMIQQSAAERESYVSELSNFTVYQSDLSGDRLVIEEELLTARGLYEQEKSLVDRLNLQIADYDLVLLNKQNNSSNGQQSEEVILARISALQALLNQLLARCSNQDELFYKQKGAIESELSDIHAKLAKLLACREDLEAKIEACNESIASLTADKTAIEAELAIVIQLITELEGSIAGCEESLEDMKAELIDLKYQLKILMVSREQTGYKGVDDQEQVCYLSATPNPFMTAGLSRRYGAPSSTELEDNEQEKTGQELYTEYSDPLYLSNLIEDYKQEYIDGILTSMSSCTGLEAKESDLQSSLSDGASIISSLNLNIDEGLTSDEVVSMQRIWYEEFKTLLGSSGYPEASDFCNIEMIPYPVEAEGAYTTVDYTVCDKILYAELLYNEYSSSGNLPLGVNGPDQMLYYLYGERLEDTYEKLNCACDVALGSVWDRNTIWSDTEKENVENTIFTMVPRSLKTEEVICKSCTDLETAISEFSNPNGPHNPAGHLVSEDDVPNYGPESALLFSQIDNYDRRLTNFLNKRFGYNQSSSYYRNAVSQCELLSDVYNGPLVSTNYTDGLRVLLNEMIPTGRYAYDYVITLTNTSGIYATNLYPAHISKNEPIEFFSSVSGESAVFTFDHYSDIFDLELSIDLEVGVSFSDILWIDELEGSGVNGSSDFVGTALLKDGSRISFSGSSNGYLETYSTQDVYRAVGLDLSNIICAKLPYDVSLSNTYTSCMANKVAAAKNKAVDDYDAYRTAIIEDFVSQYENYCFNQVNEKMEVTTKRMEYNLTLYYYDRKGNLYQTVPPEGVRLLSGDDLANAVDRVENATTVSLGQVRPNHQMTTNYVYDAMNRLVEESVPDGGYDASGNPQRSVTKYVYDEVSSKILLSQNSEQQENNEYFYMIYDDLGREIQTGEGEKSDIATYFNDHTMSRYDQELLIDASTVSEVTRTFYDETLPGIDLSLVYPEGQKNLTNRISAVTYYKEESQGITDYSSAVFYSYDVHGNVNRLVNHNNNEVYSKIFGESAYTTIDYDYELISGNVKEVVYQKSKSDQMIHRYFYDEENKVREVSTSTDEIVWDTDARYFYYDYGPMAREELGEELVQGVDYIYTLQGWLKSNNSMSSNKLNDIGKDGLEGTINQNFASDAFAYNLRYYAEDYQAIDNTIEGVIADCSQNDSIYDLYNGNISAVKNRYYNDPELLQGESVDPMMYVYRYDQLNRLKQMVAFDNYTEDASAGVYSFGEEGSDNKKDSDYYVWLDYDKNGNITHLQRNTYSVDGLSNRMDDLTYYYKLDSEGNIINNQLMSVSDAGVTRDDIEDIETQQSDNYDYDNIGNMIRDKESEIAEIKWNVSGKVEQIIREAGSKAPDLAFEYDPMGHRISKLVKPKDENGNLLSKENWTYTFYSYDPNGNVMAHYEVGMSELQSGVIQADLVLSSQPIYGTTRLGDKQINRLVSSKEITLGTDQVIDFNDLDMQDLVMSLPHDYELGLTVYEMTNHLSSVSVTLRDRKTETEVINDNGESILVWGPSMKSLVDYYPFGMEMKGRSFSTEEYRYGYQGSEKDDEVSGSGNRYTTYYRQLDPRIGRWKSIDPKARPWETPYASMGNNPIWYNDILGDTLRAHTQEAKDAIKSTLSKEEQEYVEFDDNGVLNQDRLNELETESLNFNGLKELSASEINYVVEVTDETHSGEKFHETSEDNFFRGVVEVPEASDNPSPDDNVYILVGSVTKGEQRAKTTAHEAFGHAFFYELNRQGKPGYDYNHTYERKGEVVTDPETKIMGINIISVPSNKTLETRINNVENEASKNYRENNP